MKNFGELLRRYAQEGSEQAFAEVVRHHVDLVYATAQRRVGGDSALAQDITQAVFIDLARKASSLAGRPALGGWLYRHTCFRAAQARRGEQRRQVREQTAADMNALNNDEDSLWKKIAPCLDDAMERLAEVDRDALVLRFFEHRDLRSVGAALGTSEDAAQKRVGRALEKLRGLLVKRGVTLSAAVLATLLGNQLMASAPPGLAASVTGLAISKAAAGTGAGLTLFKLMSMTKLKLGIFGAVTAGVATSLVLQQQSLMELRRENQNLRAQSLSLEQLRQEKDRLARELRDVRETQTASRDQLSELLRLRNQVSMMRNQLQVDAANRKPINGAGAAWDPGKDPNVVRADLPTGTAPLQKFSALVPAGQTLVSGGWITQPGKRVFLLTKPSSAQDANSVLLESRLVEVPDAGWDELGWEKLRTTPLQAALNVLSGQESTELLTRLNAMQGAKILATPRVLTSDQQEAMISIGESNGAGDPATGDGSFSIAVTPRVRQMPEGAAFDLVMNVTLGNSAAKQPETVAKPAQ